MDRLFGLPSVRQGKMNKYRMQLPLHDWELIPVQFLETLRQSTCPVVCRQAWDKKEM